MHAFLPQSRANGPEVRAVVWVQGCTLGCPGCFNPNAQSRKGGQWVEVEELFQGIVALGDYIEGVTLSGGEPLQQMEPVLALLARIRKKTGLSTLVFTGYTWEEVQSMEWAGRLLSLVDVLIAGPYDASRHVARGLVGSSNQTIHLLTGRYGPADLDIPLEAEAIISPDGTVTMSGIAPLTFGQKQA